METKDNDTTNKLELQCSKSEDELEDRRQSDLFRNEQFRYEVLFVPDADAQCVTEQSEQPLLGPDYMSRAGLAELVWVRRDLSMFVKRNKNQLHDYMTTGPAHTEAARLTGPARLM